MRVIDYLLDSDEAVKAFASKALLEQDFTIKKSDLIENYLSKFDHKTNLFGQGVYSPKWISTFYTLKDLYQFGIDPNHPILHKGLDSITTDLWTNTRYKYPDLCVIAMLVSVSTYAKRPAELIDEMMDYLITHYQKEDGGWNCQSPYRGDKHSSIHTTLSVLLAFRDYELNGYKNKLETIKPLINTGQEYLLRKRLFKRETNGKNIMSYITTIHFPVRWQYDIYRGLEYFASLKYPFDERMSEALDILKKQFKNTLLPKGGVFSGPIHFDLGLDVYRKMNTIRGLSILKVYDPNLYQEMINREIK